jgi:hypothetical protein
LPGLLVGTAHRFGRRGDAGWDNSVVERVRQLAEMLEVSCEKLDEKLDPDDNDIGLDVISSWKPDTRSHGSLHVLVQCATGANYKKKRGEPMMGRWRSLYYWPGRLMAGLAVPWRFSERELLRAGENADTIVFDRLRLAIGSPDSRIGDDTRIKLQNWYREQLSQLQ